MKKSSSSHHLDSLPSPITKRAKNCCFSEDRKTYNSKKSKALDSLPKRVVRKARELEPTTPPRGLKKTIAKSYGFGSLNSKSDWMSMSLSGVQIRPCHQNTSFQGGVSQRPLRFEQRQESTFAENNRRRPRPKRQIPTPPEPPLNLVLPHCARTGSRLSDHSTPPLYYDEYDDEDSDFIGGEMITPEKIESSINSLGSSPVSDSKDEVRGLSLAEYINLDTLTSSHKKAKPLPANHYNQPMMCSPPNQSSSRDSHKPIAVVGSIMRSDQKSRMQDAAFTTLMQTPCRSSSNGKKTFFHPHHEQKLQQSNYY